MKINITSGVITGVLGGAASVAVALGYSDVAAKLANPGEPQVILTVLSVVLSVVAGVLPGVKNAVSIGDGK